LAFRLAAHHQAAKKDEVELVMNLPQKRDLKTQKNDDNNNNNNNNNKLPPKNTLRRSHTYKLIAAVPRLDGRGGSHVGPNFYHCFGQ